MTMNFQIVSIIPAPDGARSLWNPGSGARFHEPVLCLALVRGWYDDDPDDALYGVSSISYSYESDALTPDCEAINWRGIAPTISQAEKWCSDDRD